METALNGLSLRWPVHLNQKSWIHINVICLNWVETKICEMKESSQNNIGDSFKRARSVEQFPFFITNYYQLFFSENSRIFQLIVYN